MRARYVRPSPPPSPPPPAAQQRDSRYATRATDTGMYARAAPTLPRSTRTPPVDVETIVRGAASGLHDAPPCSSMHTHAHARHPPRWSAYHALTVRKQAGYGYSTPFGSAGCFAPPPYTPTATSLPSILCRTRVVTPFVFRRFVIYGTRLLHVVHPGLYSNATCPKGRNP